MLFIEHGHTLFWPCFSSEDFFADVKKLGKPAEEQSDSSDSIPCSQNRPQCRFPREQVKMDEDVVMESGDAFNVDVSLDDACCVCLLRLM